MFIYSNRVPHPLSNLHWISIKWNQLQFHLSLMKGRVSRYHITIFFSFRRSPQGAISRTAHCRTQVSLPWDKSAHSLWLYQTKARILLFLKVSISHSSQRSTASLIKFLKIRINRVRNGKPACHFNSSPSQSTQDSLGRYEHCVLARTIPSGIPKQWLTKVPAVHTAFCVTGKPCFQLCTDTLSLNRQLLGMAQGSNSGWLTRAGRFWLSFSRRLWESHFTTF